MHYSLNVSVPVEESNTAYASGWALCAINVVPQKGRQINAASNSLAALGNDRSRFLFMREMFLWCYFIVWIFEICLLRWNAGLPFVMLPFPMDFTRRFLLFAPYKITKIIMNCQNPPASLSCLFSCKKAVKYPLSGWLIKVCGFSFRYCHLLSVFRNLFVFP